MGVGLRDVFVVAPATSFNHQNHESINLANTDQINGLNAAATALGVGVGVGVIPLLSAAPCLTPQNMDDQDLLNVGRNKIGGFHFWQNQASYHHSHYNIKNRTSASIFDHHNNSSTNLLQGVSTMGVADTSCSSGPTTCQDCGNQAKKDCSHRRCRTCCNSRGFDCSTHLKSTWVPAARRRERQLMTADGVGGGAGSSASTFGVKKPRLINSQTTTTSHTSTSNTTPRSFDTGSSHQDASFKENLPGQVRETAVFKCVRVTAVDDGEDEIAYQGVVKIGGHVFKGFLYDQGVETREGFPDISELHLGGGSSGRNGASSSSPVLDSADVYGPSGGGLLGGSTYGNPMS
ncbi:hypothetical protein K2173_022120 [Erythroxylum novogranatense]|uniref:Uncharacterized protein n=1 Tax=Erythroxylum novogranatense TaxID=1862640 RepID=A0AAV8TXU9_9ROSI|nr:hypothetical protein K2173_022120 [Erythroxylum novogranatense]